MGKLGDLIKKMKYRLKMKKKKFDYIANEQYKKRTGHDIKDDFDSYSGGD